MMLPVQSDASCNLQLIAFIVVNDPYQALPASCSYWPPFQPYHQGDLNTILLLRRIMFVPSSLLTFSSLCRHSARIALWSSLQPLFAGAILRKKKIATEGVFFFIEPWQGQHSAGANFSIQSALWYSPPRQGSVFHHFWFPIPRPGLIWPGSVSEGHHLDHRLVL